VIEGGGSSPARRPGSEEAVKGTKQCPGQG
jgi:hypothetical protein